MSKIAIFGGTFDPPHLGHLRIAESTLNVVDEVVFIPCYDPNHKKIKDILPFKHRMNMVNLMIKKNYRFSASEFEYDKKTKSYMIETLEAASNEHAGMNEISLLIGLDSLENITTWHKWEELIGKYRLLIYPRNMNSYKCLDSLKYNIENPLSLVLLPGVVYQISSSELRSFVRQEKFDLVKQHIDTDVFKYIKKNNLYKKEN